MVGCSLSSHYATAFAAIYITYPDATLTNKEACKAVIYFPLPRICQQIPANFQSQYVSSILLNTQPSCSTIISAAAEFIDQTHKDPLMIKFTSDTLRQYHTFTDPTEDHSTRPPSSNPTSALSSNFPAYTSTFSTSSRSPGVFTPVEYDGRNYFDSSFGRALSPPDPGPTAFRYGAPDLADLNSPFVSLDTEYYNGTQSQQLPPDLGPLDAHLRWSANEEQLTIAAGSWQIPPTFLISPSLVGPILEGRDEREEQLPGWNNQDESRNYSDDGSRGDDAMLRDREQTSLQSHQKTPLLADNSHTSTLRTTQSSRSSTFATQSKPNTSRSKSTRQPRIQSENHNQVEKQYRTRLNAYFAQLLARIPTDTFIGSGLEGGAGKVVSKAETLMMAEQYIKRLEREETVLRGENKELAEDFENLKEEWLRQGGVLPP
ncbi:uncharacterized protein PAC_17286 [Phialocephala subalpina]|uniref:BHLH domain-containing protein n=1 Tax=Phialocephala subalpina TaxID=576137 RepID=A0A1L7XR31_9HELO|nr:uncharacterized protein PAC_17286 [Phialocephala subalpina]